MPLKSMTVSPLPKSAPLPSVTPPEIVPSTGDPIEPRLSTVVPDVSFSRQ